MINTNTPTDNWQRRRPAGRHWMLVAVVIAALILVLAGGSVVAARSGLLGAVSAAPSAAPSGAAAVRSVITLANQQQKQAFAQDQPTLMRGTATAAYYAELVATDTALRNSGVTSIQLQSATFGQVVVQGNTAQATTTETWQATFADGSVTSNTSANNYTLVLVSGGWRINSDTQPRTNTPPPSTTPGTPPATTVGATSRNWSGYVAVGGTFTGVQGSWTVPDVSASNPGVDATWVGIGGATTTDLIQAGTQAIVNNGVVQYSAWIETLPQPSQTVPMTVQAGDTITVSITQQASGVWTLNMRDATSGGSYTGVVNYTSSLSSAEWIEEAPTAGRGVVLLDRFGTIQFTNAVAVENQQQVTAAAAGATSVTMVNASGVQLAAPSPLDAAGAAFSVTRG